MRRYKLTAAFLVISALTFAIAALVISTVSASQEERNVASLTTLQSTRDARLLAGTVSRMLSGELAAETAGSAIEVAAINGSEASAATSGFLAESDIIHLALYEIDGRSTWTSDGRDSPITPEQAPMFDKAVGGAVVSDVMRGRWVLGVPEPIDVVETYVPFLGAETGAPVQVLGVTRDVTGILSERIGAARGTMFRATFGSLGGGFALLLVFIVIADRAIWRSKARELARERELGDQRIAAARLDIENRELHRLNEDRGKLISLVSHELRTPLTSILAFTDILAKRQEGASAEKNREHIGVVKRSGEHLLGMIEEMLDMSRLESTEMSLDKSEFDVNVLISEVSQEIEPVLQMKRQKLQVFGDVAGCRVRADRKRMDQVLVNLLSNASKYSPEGMPIQLQVTAGTSDLRIEVRDEGIGIAEEDRHRIFGKFFRVDRKETRSVSGTGLGLAIVKTIIDQHDGEITVSPRPIRGSAFSFWIPTRVRRPAARQAPARIGHPARYLEEPKTLAALD